MNKLANSYLDAVDSLLAIHLKHYKEPVLDDWTMIVANLADAVRAMNQEEEMKPVLNPEWMKLGPKSNVRFLSDGALPIKRGPPPGKLKDRPQEKKNAPAARPGR